MGCLRCDQRSAPAIVPGLSQRVDTTSVAVATNLFAPGE
jgi:hypothetical protein